MPLPTLRNSNITGRRPHAAIVILSVAALFVFGFASSPTARAQLSASDWQTVAGGKMSFDVASVKQNVELAGPAATNFPLGPGDSYSPTGGLFSATNTQIATLIGFAYKLTPGQTQSLPSQLPKWAIVDRFDIQARGPADATKDQMRLMMQALLANRFQLAVHTETRELPVFELALLRPGKMGPQLLPHPTDSLPCTHYAAGPSSTLADGFPSACGVFLTHFDAGRIHTTARAVTMSLLASALTAFPFSLDRPILDKTGLTGSFDLTIEFALDAPIKINGTTVVPDESAPTFLEALKEQLGLKLESTKGPVDTIVIDHIEQPSEN